jgi:hypothetical protein
VNRRFAGGQKLADQLERALLVAEIAELQKQDSEAHINTIYLGLTREEQAARHKRGARIASLRLQLAELDGRHPSDVTPH